jgi:hypothetical protein
MINGSREQGAKTTSRMKRLLQMTAKIVTMVLALNLLGTVALGAQGLVGIWEKEGDETSMTFSFSEEGNGTWDVVISGDQSFTDSYRFEFILAYDFAPNHIDILNIDHGFFAEKTLYGIFRITEEETLILDFKPGPPGESAVRPEDFTDQAVTLERVN